MAIMVTRSHKKRTNPGLQDRFAVAFQSCTCIEFIILSLFKDLIILYIKM